MYTENFKVIQKIIDKDIDLSRGINNAMTDIIIGAFGELKTTELSLANMFNDLTNQHVHKEQMCKELQYELDLLKKDDLLDVVKRSGPTFNEMRSSLDFSNNQIETASQNDDLAMKLFYQILNILKQANKILGLIKKHSFELPANVNGVLEYTNAEIITLKKGSIKRNKPEITKLTNKKRPSILNEYQKTFEFSRPISNSKRSESDEYYEREVYPYLPLSNTEIIEICEKFLVKQKIKKFIKLINSLPIMRHLVTEDKLKTFLNSQTSMKHATSLIPDFSKSIFNNIHLLLSDIHSQFTAQTVLLFKIFSNFFKIIGGSSSSLTQEITKFYKENHPNKLNNFIEDLKINMPGGFYKEPRFKKHLQESIRLKLTQDEKLPKYKVIEKDYVLPKENSDSDIELSNKNIQKSNSQMLPLISPSLKSHIIIKEAKDIDHRLKNLKLFQKRLKTAHHSSYASVPSAFMKKIIRLSSRSTHSSPHNSRVAKKSRFSSQSMSSTAYTINSSSIIL